MAVAVDPSVTWAVLLRVLVTVMRSWYEFGYSGFPSGEQRQRFYRQRDDPCDSEEECDYDDETNDRPILHYPLRASEEGSCSSYSTSLASNGNDEDDVDRAADGKEELDMRLGHRRSFRYSRVTQRSSFAAPSEYGLLHSTLYEDMPARYGSSSVAFQSMTSDRVILSVQYGGAACAFPLTILKSFVVCRWASTTPDISSPSSGNAEVVTCIRMVDDMSLLSCLRWGALHPALRIGCISGDAVVPRIGHSAVPVTGIDAVMLRFFLSDRGNRTWPVSDVSEVFSPSGGAADESELPLLMDESLELYVSFVIGGATRLMDMSGSGGVARMDSGRGSAGARGDASCCELGTPNLDRMSIPASHVLSHPAVCLTLVAPSTSTWRQHTVYFPLGTPPSLAALTPRAFASLTPWPDPSMAALAVRCFAYIGGTENGRDPLSRLEVEVLQLHLDTWSWSTTPITTYGAEPPSRFGHAVTMAENNTHLLMFGGVGVGHVYLHDLHVLELCTLVWREVFIPFGTSVPRRAFGMAAVLTRSTPLDAQGGGRSRVTPHHRDATDFAQRAVECLTSGRSAGSLHAHGSAPTSKEVEKVSRDDVDSDDIWSASVTTASSEGVLVLFGGERDGEAVPSTWTCALRNGSWRRLVFPLHSLPQFTHVARSSSQTEGLSPPSVRLLPRNDFRIAMQTLADRVLHSSAASWGDLPSDPYMAVCHGSLAQVVMLPTSAQCATSLIVVGGAHGPPVSVVSEIELMGTTLKECVSQWLLAAHRGSPFSAAVRGRIPQLHTFFFRGCPTLSRATESALQPPEYSALQSRSRSAAEAHSNRLMSNSILNEQLKEWMRAARKRLREGL